jgi:Glycine zipper 2TM domain
MRRLLIAAVSTIVLFPTAAFAQTQCERAQQSRSATGTILGGLGGAAVGNAVAGHGDKKTGAIIGAIGGALLGNQLSKSNTDCAHAYGYYDSQSKWHANAVDRASAGGYFDRDGVWRSGEPNGYYDRDGVWRASDGRGYTDNQGRWVPPSVDGYYDPQDRWVVASRPGSDSYADRNNADRNNADRNNADRNNGDARDVRGREDRLRERIIEARDNGRLSRRDARRFLNSLQDIKDREARMSHRNGYLNASDEQFVQAKLDDLNRDMRSTMNG